MHSHNRTEGHDSNWDRAPHFFAGGSHRRRRAAAMPQRAQRDGAEPPAIGTSVPNQGMLSDATSPGEWCAQTRKEDVR
jgi:hypothetical protein